MVKAVLVQSSHSAYRDEPGRHYHFPKRNYLSAMARAVGDGVVFYEGRRGDARGYYAMAEVERVADDPADPTHAFALMVPGSYLAFPNEVQRARPDGRLWEAGLAPMGGNNTSAVRLISDDEFWAIVNAGLREDAADPLGLPRAPGAHPEIPDGAAAWAHEATAPAPLPPGFATRGRVLIGRAVRDRAFTLAVRRAYGGRCAVSGLSLSNGGGRPEVEAAHILPVERNGPDAVPNGIALSGTVHWMFDRGLISAADDGAILVSRGAVPEDAMRRLVRPEGRLILPERPSDRPHPAFLRWHRENVFKG